MSPGHDVITTTVPIVDSNSGVARKKKLPTMMESAVVE
jgi:hypothetical protein